MKGFDNQTQKFHNQINQYPKKILMLRWPIYECQCDERLKTKDEKSTRLVYTGMFRELDQLKIKTRLIDEMFTSVITVMGEYVFLKW